MTLRETPPSAPQVPAPASLNAVVPPERRWVLPVTILGSSMGFIDGSVVNVALPAMQGSLQSTLATMQWVINGYMLMLASLILLGGSMGDRFGRRRMFILGLVIFAAASLGCGAAPSAGWLIAARVVQGLGAALMVPASLAIIGAAYPEEERGRAIGTWAAAAAIMTAIGPPLGGWMIDTVGWRSIFFINPPIAALALLLALKLPDDHGASAPARLDYIGSALAVATLGLFSYGLVALGEGLQRVGILAVVLSLPVAGLFILAEAKSAAPMLPPALFRDRNFSGANALTVVLYAALSASLFILPFMLIEVHDYSATAAGASFLPFSVIMGGGSRFAGAVSDRLGARLPLIGGPVLTGAGFLLLGLTGGQASYWLAVFPGLVLVGIGMTISIPPLTSTVFNASPPAMSGIASGINNAAARGGGLVAVAAIGLAFGGADLAAVSDDELRSAYVMVMLASAFLALLSAICAAVAISPRVAKRSSQAESGL